jgi:hypothetical protein
MKLKTLGVADMSKCLTCPKYQCHASLPDWSSYAVVPESPVSPPEEIDSIKISSILL